MQFNRAFVQLKSGQIAKNKIALLGTPKIRIPGELPNHGPIYSGGTFTFIVWRESFIYYLNPKLKEWHNNGKLHYGQINIYVIESGGVVNGWCSTCGWLRIAREEWKSFYVLYMLCGCRGTTTITIHQQQQQ